MLKRSESISGGGRSARIKSDPHPDRFALRPPHKGEVKTSATSLRQRLLQIGDQIVDVFNPRRQPQ